MKTFLLSIFAVAIVAAPVRGQDPDATQPPKRRSAAEAAAQRNYNATVRQNAAPKTTVQPRVQQNPPVNPNRNNSAVAPRTYTPKTPNPNYGPRTRTNPQTFTPPDQDSARANLPSQSNANAKTWQDRSKYRNNPNAVPPRPNATPVPNVQSNTTAQNNPNNNRDWRNRDRTNNNNNQNWQNSNNPNWQNNNNRNWQNNNRSNIWTYSQARQYHNRSRHDRGWWHSHYNRIALFAGGYYYWNSGYWYPAYGYDPYYSSYRYDEPIYGYNNLDPGQVIANVQTALQEQGYYRDAVDGLIGPRTRSALSDFQRDRGLPITSAIDGPTLQALGLY